MSEKKRGVTFITPDTDSQLEIPFVSEPVHAGFPSPAEDYSGETMDLNRELVKNPLSTFYARVMGDSMQQECIREGDLLVIDRSVEPYDGCVALCYIDGEFTLKHVRKEGDHILLVPANPKYSSIKVTEENEFLIWGVVRYSIQKH